MIEAGDSHLRIAEFETRYGGAGLVRGAAYVLPEPLQDGRIVDNLKWFTRFVSICLQAGGFERTSKTVVALPDSLVRSKVFDHPKAKAAVVLSVAKLESESILRGDPSGYTIQVKPVTTSPDEDGQLRSVLYAVETELLDRIHTSLTDAGFEILRVVPRMASFSSSLSLFLAAQPQFNSATLAALDFSDGRVQLVVLEQGVPVFESSYRASRFALRSTDLIDHLVGEEGIAYTIPEIELEAALQAVASEGEPSIVGEPVEPTLVSAPVVRLIDASAGDSDEEPGAVSAAAFASIPTLVPRPMSEDATSEPDPGWDAPSAPGTGFFESDQTAIRIARYLPGTRLTSEAEQRLAKSIDSALHEALQGLRIVLAAEGLKLHSILISGAYSRFPGVAEAIRDAIDTEVVSIGDFVDELAGTVRFHEPPPSSIALTEAFSLLGGGIVRRGPSVDFIAGRSASRRDGLMQWALAGVITLGVVGAMAIVPYQLQVARDELEATEQTLSSAPYVRAEKLRADRTDLALQVSQDEATSTPLPIGQSKSWEVHRDLHESVGHDMKRFSASYRADTGELPLRFTLRPPDAFASFKIAIEGSRDFDIAIPLNYTESVEESETVANVSVTLRYKDFSPLDLASPITTSTTTANTSVKPSEVSAR